MKIKTSELTGAALDWAVANAAEVWNDAHEWFPTMTIDPSFSGVQPMIYSDGQAACQLTPNNPFRQDYQIYAPSMDWSQGGPLISELMASGQWEMVQGVNGKIWFQNYDRECIPVDRTSWDQESIIAEGPTPLIAACRAVVAANMGDTVDVPDELAGVVA